MAKVIVYSTTVCPWCVKVKEFLRQNNVEYEERNAQENPDYASEVMQKSGGMAVPVTDIDGTIIVGFNVKKLKEALKIA
ncbi:MAG TPA: glutaredoxin family protein [Candidatus Bilamarchaeum sp.]|nr:glutaredoxin family protein [Candidatus Bilamarchaeum sp.]